MRLYVIYPSSLDPRPDYNVVNTALGLIREHHEVTPNDTNRTCSEALLHPDFYQSFLPNIIRFSRSEPEALRMLSLTYPDLLPESVFVVCFSQQALVNLEKEIHVMKGFSGGEVEPQSSVSVTEGQQYTTILFAKIG